MATGMVLLELDGQGTGHCETFSDGEVCSDFYATEDAAMASFWTGAVVALAILGWSIYEAAQGDRR